MLKKLERETGRNYVFEQAQLDKNKRYANSMGNLSTVNFGSPPQTGSHHRLTNAHATANSSKAMMN